MKKQIVNPYLPCWEYIPDGEPHVFHDRLYLFGSHDAFNGERFCQNDYVCWSAPIDDLSDWTFHGVIYRKTQDPRNDGTHVLYAPDVVQGKDGRYYLYYTLDLCGFISVAVAIVPEGPYTYYGVVRDQTGAILGMREGDVFQYDPGVLVDEEGFVHLYSGVDGERGPIKSKLAGAPQIMDGAYHFKLLPDMLTLCDTPKRIAPGARHADGTPFEGHSFFEASSIRKLGTMYYFIYSSINSHELCYATCKQPDGCFQFGGVIISIGDIGLSGRKRDCDATNHLGTTHGSIQQIAGKWYVFYHRQTNDNQFSRQACAERITFGANGTIPQVEVSSCGLNDGPLVGEGVYEARIACNLSGKNGPLRYFPAHTPRSHCPYFTQDEPDNEQYSNQYIANLQKGSWAGFKYFTMNGADQISVCLRAPKGGKVTVSTQQNGIPVAQMNIRPCTQWTIFSGSLTPLYGKTALFFTFDGEEEMSFQSFALNNTRKG